MKKFYFYFIVLLFAHGCSNQDAEIKLKYCVNIPDKVVSQGSHKLYKTAYKRGWLDCFDNFIQNNLILDEEIKLETKQHVKTSDIEKMAQEAGYEQCKRQIFQSGIVISDVNGNRHAIILILLPLVCFVLILCGKRKFTTKKFLCGFCCLLGMFFLGMFLGGHSSGIPFFQWLIPGLCILLVLAVEADILRYFTVIAFLVVGFYICNDYGHIVRTETYTGNPDWVILKNKRKGYQEKIVIGLWHTDLTGLFRMVVVSKRYSESLCIEKYKDMRFFFGYHNEIQ